MKNISIFLLFMMCLAIPNLESAAPQFTVESVEPKIITPTSQYVTITVKTTDLTDMVPTGKIFDITGRQIKSMEQLPAESFAYDINTGEAHLTWTPGNDVPSGVYIYQLDVRGYVYNGTLVVAR